MRDSTPELDALLASRHFFMCDLYELTTVTESVLRLTTFDLNITYGGHTYSSGTPIVERTKCSWGIGLDTKSLNIKIYPKDVDLIDGLPILPAIRHGVFDGCTVVYHRAFFSDPLSRVPVGAFQLFSGRVAGIDADRTLVELTVNSDLELLDAKMPRRVYGPSCGHILYGPACQATKASFTFAGTVGSGATISSIPVSGLTKADAYFDLGVLTLAGGSIRRTIKSWDSGVAKLIYPLRTAPTTGASLSVIAGCDHTLTVCTDKFDNRDNFGGHPYIPEPETAA